MHLPRSSSSRKQLPASRWRQRRLAQAPASLTAAQERQLATLQAISALLAGQHAIDALCRGFLRHVMDFSSAVGGTVRILDPHNDTVHIVVHEGISDAMLEEEHCMRNNDCLCGAAVAQGVIQIRDFRKVGAIERFRCQEEGFSAIAVFPIVVRDKPIGSFSLHFVKTTVLGEQQHGWLATLGHSLGIAIDNQRLIAREKEFAVARERSLLAEGLHDSIAQSLNFISLQVQMLDDSVRRGELGEAADVLPLMRMGVEQSYQDVRELLVNFRTRWHGSDLESKLAEVLGKFELQTGIASALQMTGNGAPLAPEQQLQVLFIVQEALSNIRKHAQAGKVQVMVDNGRDFSLQVRDDGEGFAADMRDQKTEVRIGLRIMQERAERLGARFVIDSTPGGGTTISLALPETRRQTA
ncbi:GAF domain-containing sensor histidine kinase [Janthinobacterium psychrotolerans]|uniref:Oxygen sensor histidine kinase NreB n=1 Tax=Janthinobacterium psychrotolerans TaxID=1747903 RepID=A0A1A7C019_9BURK|nr:ATP-binding protein [Janthinobacterium psychrotolerans]OBV39276.1 two-component system, NarL family, nitrate/nitrite sensor histidine kinase NarX [Janthinobacterium psychrotolerans]